MEFIDAFIELDEHILLLQNLSFRLEPIQPHPKGYENSLEKKTSFYRNMYKSKYDQLVKIEKSLIHIFRIVKSFPVAQDIIDLVEKINEMKPFKNNLTNSEYTTEIDLFFNAAHSIQVQISKAKSFLPIIISKLNKTKYKSINKLTYNQTSLLVENEKLKHQIAQLRIKNNALLKKQNETDSNNKISFSVKKDHPRGGCKLTDLQIERLLLIYAKRGKYARMTLNKALSTIAQTSRTYYKIIKRDYVSMETRNRIKRIADENGITLPPIGGIRQL
ncbi:hypothetical protein IGI39_004461 [Enterococcus sp. AZ135]|uniref:hypothetical protein n=1 Tax=unclassified Enterococcus TaxID=2608891 RepID=UPI003F1F2B23